MAGLELVRSFGEDLAVVRFDRIVVTFIRGPLSIEYLDCAHETGKRTAEQYRGRIGSLTLIPDFATLPEGPVRERAKRATVEANDWVAAGATVVGGRGFVASAVRSIILTVTVFSGGPPRKVFAEVGTSLDWLESKVDLAQSIAPLTEWASAAMQENFRIADTPIPASKSA